MTPTPTLARTPTLSLARTPTLSLPVSLSLPLPLTPTLTRAIGALVSRVKAHGQKHAGAKHHHHHEHKKVRPVLRRLLANPNPNPNPNPNLNPTPTPNQVHPVLRRLEVVLSTTSFFLSFFVLFWVRESMHAGYDRSPSSS